MQQLCIISDLRARPFGRRVFGEKQEIISKGRPCPEIKTLFTVHKTKNGLQDFVRHFHVEQYTKVIWLAGSAVIGKVFCWPCLLFCSESSVWTTEGYGNLNAFHTASTKHERSKNHIQSFIKLNTFGDARIDLQLDEQQRVHVSQHNEMVKKNREIIRRLIDTTCHLAKQELAFRGHDESNLSLNRGNYVETLDLLSSYDPLLKAHLETSTVFRGTSNHIQNDLITAINQVVTNEIRHEVDDAVFMAILLDEATDITNLSQMSTVLRYVTNDGKAHERFVGFTDMSADKTAGALFEHVVKVVEEFDIGEKLIAQSYDGASVMSGHLTGLCTRVQERFPRAIFIHCFAHKLNLVLGQVCKGIKECCIFFTTMSGIAAFFSQSPKRSAALKTYLQRKLPKVAPTRWNFTSRLVNTTWEFLPELIEFFEDVTQDTEVWDQDTLLKANGFRLFLTSFENLFLLCVFSRLFGHTDVLYNNLQAATYDIAFCSRRVKDTIDIVNADRERFDELWNETEARREMCDIELPGRRRRVAESPEDVGRRVYYQIIDTMSCQLTTRFTTMDKYKFIQLLSPDCFIEYNQHFPRDIFDVLSDTYHGLFDIVRLQTELTVMYSMKEFREKHPYQLVSFMKASQLHNGMPELYKLGCLCLTIPSTTASVERSFSALKRIKTYSRSTQGQERLSGLALLSIEKSVLLKLKEKPDFYDRVINEFTRQVRRMEFEFK